jgi:hypothetical protein
MAVMMERWLPGLGIVAGVCLMTAAAVAQGQPDAGSAASATRGVAADADSPRPGPHGGWGRHEHGGGPEGRESMCKEGYAREAGFLAYLGAKLDLTPAQQPLWDNYYKSMLDSAGKLRQVCLDNAGPPTSPPTALTRRDRMEKFLTARLDFLHATRPQLEALYQDLSPEQRAILDHPHRHGPRPER